MANLKVSIPQDLYEKLQKQAREEQRSTSQQVVHLLREALAQPEPRSILELRGLGREMWAEIDPVEHVDRERRSWD